MKRSKLFILIFLLTIFNACQDRDDLIQVSIDEGNNVLSLKEYEFTSTGGELALAFTANTSWTLSGCPSWLSIKDKYKSGRAGTTNIIMNVDCNETRAGRDAVLTFTAKDGSFESTLKISQPFPYLNIDADSLHFNWNDCRTIRDGVELENNPQKINISSNVQWKIKEVKSTKADVDISHFTLSANSGENDYELSVIPIKDNFDKVPYDLQLKLYAVYYDEKGNEKEVSSKAADSYIIKLHQRNLKFLINGSPDDEDIEFTELNDNPNINFNIDAEVEWTVAEKPSWVVLKQTPNQDDGTINVNFLADGANPDTLSRAGVVKLSTGAIGAYRCINVSQKPYVFKLNCSEQRIANDDTTSVTRTLKTTGTWEVDTLQLPKWLTVESSLKCEVTTRDSHKDEHEIIFRANAQNLDFEDYKGYIVVKSTMNDLVCEIPVSQEQFIFDVKPHDDLSNLGTMNTAKYPVTIDSSGPWEITGIEDWVSVSKCEADTKGSEIIQVGPTKGNPDLENDRTVTLKVVSRAHKNAGKNVTKNITIKQSKFVFKVLDGNNPVKDTVSVPVYKEDFKDHFSIDVECSIPWTIECPSWVSANPSSGDGNKPVKVSFTPTNNINKDAGRHDPIKVLTATDSLNLGNEFKKEFSFIVDQGQFVFNNEDYNSDTVPVMSEGKKEYSVGFLLTEGVPWEITFEDDSDEWLKPNSNKGVGARGETQVIFKPSSNPNTIERKGTAILKCCVTDGKTTLEESKRITFTQEKYEFDQVGESFEYTELDEGSRKVTVTSSGRWKIESKPEWIKVSQNEGNTNNDEIKSNIDISVEPNYSLENRSDSIEIVSWLNPKLKKVVKVEQEKYLFALKPETIANYGTLDERTDTIDVQCSGHWRVKRPEWLSVSTDSGEGSQDGAIQKVIIKSQENLDTTRRSGFLKIISEHGHEKSIAVSQDPFLFEIVGEGFEYNDPLDITQNSFNVNCSSDWTAKVDQDWVHIQVNDGAVKFAPQQNLTRENRSAKITVSSTKGGHNKSFIISQVGFKFDVGPTKHRFDSPIAEENSKLTVNVDCSSEWNAMTDEDWIEISDKGQSSFNVSVKDNSDFKERTGRITVKSKLGNYSTTIEITQAPFVFDVNQDPLNFTSYNPNQQTVEVDCSGSWDVDKKDCDWITLIANEKSFTIKVDNNIQSQPRSATIIVRSVLGPHEKEIVVNQEPYEFNVQPTLLEFDAFDASNKVSKSLDINCSGEWSIENNSTWLTCSKDSGIGQSTVTLSVNDNASVESRDAVVVVRSKDNAAFTTQIKVTQEANTLTVEQTKLSFGASKSSQNVKISTNGPWKAVVDQEWCELSENATDNSLLVEVASNVESKVRTATITITSTKTSTLVKTITVEQAAANGQ